METSINNNYSGYNTYVLGTANSILNCLNIVVYDKYKLPENTEKLSLYNIDSVYQVAISSGICTTLTRLKSTEVFNYYTDGLGFNTIIYLSNSDGSPIGYTEFLSIQGKDRNINISLSFNSEITGGFTVELANSLSQLRNNTTVKKNFIGDELFEYPSSKKIIDDLNDISLRNPDYTTHLSSVLHSNNKNIYLRNGILNGTSLIKLDFSFNVNINPFGYNFNNYQFGYYRTDIVIYSWKDSDVSIYSITKRNRFGNPISYINSSKGYITIPKYTTDKDQTILYFSGKYVILEIAGSSSNKVIYDLEKKSWITKYSDFIVDPLDINSNIIELPKVLNYNNISRYLPKISNIFLNIKEYSNTNSISITKKIGDWIVIERKRDNLVLYSNMNKTLYLSKEETPIIINNKLIMIHTIDNNLGLDYYTIYNSSGETFYSERARVIIETTSTENEIYTPKLELSEDLGILFCTGGKNDEKYRQYYKTSKIIIVQSSESLTTSYFSQFRRNNLPSDSLKIPNIIGSIGGLLYYIQDKFYLNYL